MVNRIRRYAQIMDILGKYGFGIGLEKMFPGKARFRLPIPGKDPDASTVYERMRLALEELGPTFIKFGQIMSTRTELLPPELIDQLKKNCRTMQILSPSRKSGGLSKRVVTIPMCVNSGSGR